MNDVLQRSAPGDDEAQYGDSFSHAARRDAGGDPQ